MRFLCCRLIMMLLVWTVFLTGSFAAEYRYSYIPKHIFTTQVFPVTIQALHANPSQPVLFQFDPNAKLKPLNLTPVRMINGHDLFFTFYFQASGEDDLHLPNLVIRESNQTFTLPGHTLHMETLHSHAPKHFCGLIATDCTVRSSQVSMFDTNTTLVSITFQAHEANPEAIRIPGALEEGLENISRDGSQVIGEYYFVIPSYTKKITLSYYNTVQRRFVPVTIATDYHTRSVAAQVELNPKASPFDKLKKYGAIALAFFFALMFWWQRDRLYLLLLIIIIALLYTIYQPRAMVCVREGSSLLILPTHNSRTVTSVAEELHTRSLGRHGGYHKINYHNGIIGWIRDEDLCQN